MRRSVCTREWASALLLVAVWVAALPAGAQGSAPPRNLKIAFIADQGLGADAEDVLELILAEGADAVVHSGDFDYDDDPDAWDDQINGILGPNFPYFASVGNHDTGRFSADDESGAYQQVMVARMNRLGIPWEGVLGVKSSLYYEGIFILLTAPDVFGDGDDVYAPYIRDQLAADESIWRISRWHKNMRAMQVGGKRDEAGWGVYEESRAGGAIIATGHEHSYSRTHLLASCELQEVASQGDTLVLSADDPLTIDDEGRSFVFVSGLGGRSIRNQDRDGDWWASIYTSDQGANHGALFGEFNYQGDPRLARFYFKDIDGNIPDEFFVESSLGRAEPRPEPLTRALRSCIRDMGGAFVKVAERHSKLIATCMARHASGKLSGTLANCLAADAKGKVSKAMARTESAEARRCTGLNPPFGASDASSTNGAARQSGIGVIEGLFGPDLDAAINAEAGDRATSRCQQAVAGAALKCHDARLAEFLKCKEAGLRDGGIQSADELLACVVQEATPRLAKACHRQIERAVERKCIAVGADLATAFPGCGAEDPNALANCVRDGVSAQSCLAIGEADGLRSDVEGYAQTCDSTSL